MASKEKSQFYTNLVNDVLTGKISSEHRKVKAKEMAIPKSSKKKVMADATCSSCGHPCANCSDSKGGHPDPQQD